MLQVTLPLAGVEVFWPAILLMGCFIGFLTGLFGVGGGFLLTPALKIIFGVPYPVAVGSSLGSFLGTASLSAYRHHQRGCVDLRMGVLLAAGALGGTATGRYFMTVLTERAGVVIIRGQAHSLVDLALNTAFFVLIGAVTVFILAETSRSAAADRHEADSAFARALQKLPLPPRADFRRSGIRRMSVWVPLAVSYPVGILTGLLGVGGGFVNLPLLVYVIGMPTVQAVGASAFQIVFASGFGLLLYLRRGQVDLLLVALLLAGSLIGTQAGVWFAHRIGGRRLRRWFAVVLSAGMLLVLYDLVSMLK